MLTGEANSSKSRARPSRRRFRAPNSKPDGARRKGRRPRPAAPPCSARRWRCNERQARQARRPAGARNPQPGQARASSASCCRRSGSSWSRRLTRPARTGRDRYHVRGECADQGARRGRWPPALSRSPTIRALRRCARRPARRLYRQLGGRRTGARLRNGMRRVEDALQAAGASTPAQRRGSFNATLCLAHPDGREQLYIGNVEGTLVWPPRGDMGFGFDPVFMPDGFDITFGEMPPEAKHSWAPGESASRTARGLSPSSWRARLSNIETFPAPVRAGTRPRQRPLRRLCPLAVLRRQVPLLRLQLARPSRRVRRSHVRRELRARDRPLRRAGAGPPGAVDLLRRRHALADGPALGRGHPRGRSAGTGRSMPRPRSRSRPTRPASRPTVSAAIARRASTASRSACSRCARDRWPSSAAAILSTRPSPRCGSRSRSSRARLRPDLCAPATDARGLARRADRGAVARPGPHLALPAHHRAGDALLRPPHGRQAQDAGRGPRRRFLRADAGADATQRACLPTRFRTTPGPARRAPTTSSTGATANMPGSAPARTAAC